MCFGKKTETPTQDNAAAIARPYLEGKKRFLDLNFDIPKDRRIALACLNTKSKPFLEQLTITDESHVTLLDEWIKADYKNFIKAYRLGIYNSALAEKFLYKKFEANKDSEGVSMMQSLKKKTLLRYRYATKNGQTISYFDSALGVPTQLMVSADICLKIIDGDKLITAMDFDIGLLDLKLTMEAINATATKIIRDTLLECIMDNKLSYYQLPQYYSDLNEALRENLNAAYAPMGIEISDISILDISVPNDTNEKFESQFFAIAEQERFKRYEYRMEGLSLDLYAKKAEIHNKYPDFPVTLTEAEKDFALNRYLNRNGISTTPKADIHKKKLADVAKLSAGTKVAPQKEDKLTIQNTFRKIFILALLLCLAAAALVCIASVGGGLIAIGAVVLIFGLIAVAKMPALLFKGIDDDAIDEMASEEKTVKEIAPSDFND